MTLGVLTLRDLNCSQVSGLGLYRSTNVLTGESGVYRCMLNILMRMVWRICINFSRIV